MRAPNSATGYLECVCTCQHSGLRALAVMRGEATARPGHRVSKLVCSKESVVLGTCVKKSLMVIPGLPACDQARVGNGFYPASCSLHGHSAAKMVDTKDVAPHQAPVDISMKDLPI